MGVMHVALRRDLATHSTACVLALLAGLHVVWGRGSAFPFPSRRELADAVVGTQNAPPPGACYTVAAALMVAAGLVEDTPSIATRIRRSGLLTMTSVFGIRAALGWSGRTDLVSPGSDSVRFRRLDQRVYAPLCAALAAGSLSAFRRTAKPKVLPDAPA